MVSPTLSDLLDSAPNPVRALRSVPYRPLYSFPGWAPEFTNWRSEQAAWHETAALMDQSHHMVNFYVTGPDALRLFSDLGANSFAGFRPGMAKQLIASTAEGGLVGDGILAYLDENSFDFMGEPGIVSWVQFHIETGDYDVAYEREGNALTRNGQPPREYRFELQGPAALDILEAVTGSPVPATKFFHIAEFTIAGHRVRGIRHGMAGQPGFELFGPWAEREPVVSAVLETGATFGLKQAGSIAYFTSNIESGWVGRPVPAIFTADSTKAYRDWLPAAGVGSLGGSFDSEEIEDYYLTAHDLGYTRFVSDDHDYLGRDAVLADAARPASKQKVSLIWDDDDFANIFGGLVRPDDGLPPQYIEVAASTRYCFYQYDAVRLGGGTVGFTTHAAYVSPHRRFISLAVVDAEHAAPGTEVEVVWGDSLSAPRAQIEPHRQVTVRATVAPIPFDTFAREQYRK